MRLIAKRNLMLGSATTATCVSMLVGLSPAAAQQVGDPPSPSSAQDSSSAASPAAPGGAASAPTTNEIVVTGSRIARRDYQANSPLVTVAEETFENRSAIGVEDALNDLPQFTPAGSASITGGAGAAFSGADAAPGAATLNLRGLGTNRTLVLVNGRRAQPVNAQLVVDVNTIPTAAVKNVEVITGGAAAVYGADAIAGVVNFMLKDNFEGLELDGQYGMSEVGDNITKQVSALVGGNLSNGRGNATLGLSWSDRSPAYQRKREFYRNSWADPATSAAGGGLPITIANVGGVNWGVNPDGSLFNTANAANPAAPFKGPLQALAGGSGFKLNPPAVGSTNQSLGFNNPAAQVNVPLSRYSLFGSAHYDVTDSVTMFFEGNFTHSKAYAQSIAGTASGIWAPSIPYTAANDDPDSPTFGSNRNNWHPVSRQLADLLNARAPVGGVPGTNQNWTMGRGLNFLGDLYIETVSDIYQLTAGFRGEVGVKDWTWELYGSHGNTNVVVRQPQGAISYANLQQLISGTTFGTTTPPGRSLTINGPWSAGWTSGSTFNPSSCTSGIPFFNADGSVPQLQPGQVDHVTVSQDCKDFATLELNNVTSLKQNIVEGTVQGALFNWWAGEVRFAAGATYRKEDFFYNPDSGISGEQPTTGVVNQIVLPKPTRGAIAAHEAYAELLIPLLKDLPLVEQFDLEIGGRYSRYSLSGDVKTYKILGDWRVTPWLRLRGGFQRANRAPNVYELFAPSAGVLGASADPCLNVPGETPSFGNLPSNANRLNLQTACNALMVRDGGFDYRTLAEDPTAVDQAASGYPNIDNTRMSNFRWKLGYNVPFAFSIALNQGNKALESEKANTITLGAVINSPFQTPALRRLTFTVDYYSIDLKGTISTPSGTEIYSQCLNPQFNPRMAAAPGTYTGDQLLEGNQFCALVNRYPFDERGVVGAVGSGTDRTYDAPFINKGGTKTSGLDITGNWTIGLEDVGLGVPGSINLNGSANILLKFKEASFQGASFVDLKGTNANANNQAFKYKLFGTASYIWDKGSIGIRGRFLPSIDPSPFAAVGTTGANAHKEFDLFARYQLTDRLDLRAGVDNLFDAKPEVVGATPSNANTGSTLPIYDTFGRGYFAGLKLRL